MCWIIRALAAETQTITVKIEYMNLQEGTEETCNADVLEIRDGMDGCLYILYDFGRNR